MPFTAAHPAIVLPFNSISKRFISLTALVIGSITPDFEYFLRMRVSSIYSHTIWGLLYFDLPVGLALYWLYQTKVRDILIERLPSFLRKRFWNYRNLSENSISQGRVIIIVLCVLTGAASHLLWDSFTHESGWMVNHFSGVLKAPIVSKPAIPSFKILQHTSTFAGFIVIGYAIIKLPKAEVTGLGSNTVFWTKWFVLLSVIFSVRMVVTKPFFHVQIGNLIVSFISAALLALLAMCIIVRLTGGNSSATNTQ